MMRLLRLMGLVGAIAISLTGCVSVGSLGVITKSSVDPVSVLGKSHSFKELGPAEGQACRYFALAVIPWGNSDIQTAVDRALLPTEGDALVNVTTSTSLYGFVPIYNVFSFTCTSVKGTAVKLESASQNGNPG
jgi:hypothetical protein